MMLAFESETLNVLYALAFFVMAGAAVFEAFTVKRLTTLLLASASLAVFLLAVWNP